jgi:haloalkane dehalogenase
LNKRKPEVKTKETAMQRRSFIGMMGTVLAAGAISACVPPLSGVMNGSVRAAATPPLDAAAFHAARRFASTPFGRIAYIDRGAGEAALFLHGFPLNSFQWRGAIDRLSLYRRCIAPDFLAMGYTEVAAGQSVAPEAQVAMLVSLLDTLAIGSVDVIANDSGGQVAQLLMTRHPTRVRSLLLSNCDTEIDSPPAAMLPVIELAKAGAFVDQWLGSWRADKALARSAEGIGGMCFADPSNPTDEAIEMYFAPLLSSPQRKALAHQFAIALEHNPLIGIAAELKRSTVPTRILWGTSDTIFSAESPDYLHSVFGNSRGVRRLAGSKLFWPEERPEVIAEEALRLWGLAERMV